MALLVNLLIYLIVIGVLLWLIWYVLNAIPVPDPPRRWLWMAVVVVTTLIVLSMLMSALGGPDLGLPRLR